MRWIRTATPTGISRGAVECCTRRGLPREGARRSSPVGSPSVAGTRFVAPLSPTRERERERESVCVYERESVCVCEREGESLSLYSLSSLSLSLSLARSLSRSLARSISTKIGHSCQLPRLSLSLSLARARSLSVARGCCCVFAPQDPANVGSKLQQEAKKGTTLDYIRSLSVLIGLFCVYFRIWRT